VIAAPTGTGKTSAAARHVAEAGRAIWLADRHEDINAASQAIEENGGTVGRVLPLDGVQEDGTRNCLFPVKVKLWQAKGYTYRAGFCVPACPRGGNPDRCPFLASIDALEGADNIVVTKALARQEGFFSQYGNRRRGTVIIDEDPVEWLRPAVRVTRKELDQYLPTITAVAHDFREMGAEPPLAVANHYLHAARWLWDRINDQEPDGQPHAAPIPDHVVLVASHLPARALRRGRQCLHQAFWRLMREDPAGTVRNVTWDLGAMERAVANTVFVTSTAALFHVAVNIPTGKRVFVLDATANAELLRPILAPREVQVVCDERVQPAGRVIQFMDFNGPRQYLNKHPAKLIRMIDAIGDLHPHGAVVLISHASCVMGLRQASRHARRIRTAHFGALRGRNDLEPSPRNQVACHIVAGSPKTNEESRRELALSVYGSAVLPFADLIDVRRAVVGRVPQELVEGDAPREQVWEVRLKGYTDPWMQAVYDHTVTAELTHAADRARVLLHRDAVVYLLTNEPCPRLWFAEMCYASDLLDLSDDGGRADFRQNYAGYEAKAKELLDAGNSIGNADVCRALGRPRPGWGKRYWTRFLERFGDSLEGERKVRWKDA
jgi:hypothetical protein